MGAMTSCMGGMNSHPSKEVHFNLMNSPRNSLRDKKSNFVLNKEAILKFLSLSKKTLISF